MSVKRALITGITGQDGSYLAEFLSEKGYMVYGLMRRTSTDPFARVEHLYTGGKVKFIYGNMRDLSTLIRALQESHPHEIYNLAAQSHVGVSFLCPEETIDINYNGVKRLVTEAARQNPRVKIYQASTSEMFGNVPPPQNEISGWKPVSPYGESKLKAHNFVKKMREEKGIFAVSGILFNHESPRRGKHFVTRKITHSLVKLRLGLQPHIELGNLDAKRDWGHAKDYVEAMWMMLQAKKPDDYVIATGESHTVREFVEAVGRELGLHITWRGKGAHEVGVGENGEVVVCINPRHYRPREVHYLLGDISKARKKLGWEPKIKFNELVRTMVASDLKLIAGNAEHFINNGGGHI